MTDKLTQQQEFAELQAWMNNPRQDDHLVDTYARIRQTSQNLPFASELADTLGARQTEQVILHTGQLDYQEKLDTLHGNRPLVLALRYQSRSPHSGLFGQHWCFQYEQQLHLDKQQKNTYQLRLGDGRRFNFQFDPKTSQFIDAGNLGAQLRYLEKHKAFELHYFDGLQQYYQSNGKLLGETDANGNRIDLKYDAQGRLSQLSNSSGSALVFYYPSNQTQVQEIRDHSGRCWVFEYTSLDGQAILTQITTPAGAKRHYQYQNHPEHANSTGNNTQSGPHHSQLLTKATNSLGHELIACRYTSQGLVQLVRQKGIGTGTRYQYKQKQRNIIVDDINGNTTIYHLTSQGLIDSIFYPNEAHQYLRWEADKHTAILGNARSENGRQVYDQRHRLLEETDQDKNTTQYIYEGNNSEPSKIITATGQTQHHYDDRYNVLSTTDEKGRTEQYEYDKNGNLTQITDAEGHATQIDYSRHDLAVTITDAKGHTYTNEYDILGRETRITDAEGRITQLNYRPDHHITQVIDPLQQTVGFDYNTEGQLLSLNDPVGNQTRYIYNAQGQLGEQHRPSGQHRFYRYHSNGKLACITREDGTTIDLKYNELDQLVTESYYPASPKDNNNSDTHTALAQHPETLITHYEYDDDENLSLIKNAHSNVRFDYNDQGQIEQQTQDGICIDTAYVNDQAVSLSYLDQSISYQRDPQGILNSVLHNEQIITLHRNQRDILTQRHYPNQQSESLAFDENYHLTQIQTADQDIRYKTDNTGFITQKGHSEYEYDNAGRLIRNGLSVYQYDTAGNLLQHEQIDPNQREVSSTPNNQYNITTNQLTENQTHRFVYDLRGNLIQKIHKASNTTQYYRWNLRDQLLDVKGEKVDPNSQSITPIHLSFQYDAIGRRSEKRNHQNNTKQQYLYDKLNIVAIACYDADNEQTVATLVHDETIDTPLSIQNKNGIFYYHRDHQRSIIALTDERGKVVESIEYDNDYGQITRHTKTVETNNPYSYTGRESDLEDLYYYRARYYDPITQRFISEDPIGFMSGDFNFYRYVKNAPINWIDSFGLKRRCNKAQKDKIKKRLSKAKKARKAFNAAKVIRAGVRAAALADLATIEPTDLMPWKWVAEAVILGATEAAFAVLESQLMDSKELAKLEADDKDCKKREKEAKAKEDAAAKVKSNKKSQKKGKCKDPTGKKTEIKMHKYYFKKGYKLISSGKYQGIDGVYKNMTGGTPKYIIADAKFGTSSLSKTVTGSKQMSRSWVNDRLDNQLSRADVRDIDKEGYQAEEFHVDHKCQKTRKILKQKWQHKVVVKKTIKIR